MFLMGDFLQGYSSEHRTPAFRRTFKVTCIKHYAFQWLSDSEGYSAVLKGCWFAHECDFIEVDHVS